MDTSILLAALAGILVAGLAVLSGIGLLNKKRSGLDHAYYQAQWQKIEALKSGSDHGWQLAVFEADKLLDQALKARGFAGATMGDRLKSADKAFMNTNAVWDAHKLRNRLAHEQNVKPGPGVVDGALRNFKAGLKDLGAL